MNRTIKDSAAIFALILLLFGALAVLAVRARIVSSIPHPGLYAVAFLHPEEAGNFELTALNFREPLELTYEARDSEDQLLASGSASVTPEHPVFNPLASLSDAGELNGRITIRIIGPEGTPRELSKVLP